MTGGQPGGKSFSGNVVWKSLLKRAPIIVSLDSPARLACGIDTTMTRQFSKIDVTPDWEGLVRCIRRQGPLRRVHFIELYLDGEVQEAISRQFGVAGNDLVRQINLQRFLGYDYVLMGLDNVVWTFPHHVADDTAGLARASGRGFVESGRGPITNWEEFERYPWPVPTQWNSRSLEWLTANLPDDMCIIGGLCSHFAEHLSRLMGYETLCLALYDQRELVKAIADRVLEIDRVMLARLLEFDRVKIIWGSDDMGFRTGPLISPADLREFVLPGHKLMAQMAHAAGRPYLLHCCGQLTDIMPDLIDDVRIDARHSFEDVIEPVTEAKRRYGQRIALLGGLDVDFLCRASIPAIRERVRRTLEVCLPGGGYCLGTGNSVTNYIPVENYLAMLDAGRKFSPA